ncbi:hypothetical protein [Chelativorans sp. AA-79]|uniref:hypothetical protein n=1 Tax=Chelativorans sp. AA-79 TaxID=3028735 RepID=UPI0023F7CF72|nr:hypothetical protein [Chelativorans sp. AA-79]WEX09513.1 hypothetical protein PVE73_00640 [Chelativorans sp. AA-79]
MPYRRKAKEAGILNPVEVELLGRVFDTTAVPGETEHDRETRASRILGYYLAGITDEEELVGLAKQPLGR